MTKFEKLMDIDNAAFNRLTEPELRKIVRELNRTANQRLRRMEARGFDTGATKKAKNVSKRFTTRGKGLNELRAEFMRVSNFLRSRTSTYRGLLEVRKETAATLKRMGVEIDPKNLESVLRIYEKLKERSPWLQLRGIKYQVFQQIDKIDSDLDMDEKLEEMQHQLEDLYEEARNNDTAFDAGVSGYFA